MPRIAYFGGTFDPPHNGHRAIALAAAEAFALDRVLFAPTGRQPLKPEAASASFADRLAMTRLLCKEDGRFEATNLDAPHEDGSPNYTIDALRALQAAEPAAQLFVLVGADAFADLHHWRSPEALLAIAEWIVVSRPGIPAQAATTRIHTLTGIAQTESATELRHCLASGEDCSSLTAPAVLDFIRTHHLYQGELR